METQTGREKMDLETLPKLHHFFQKKQNLHNSAANNFSKSKVPFIKVRGYESRLFGIWLSKKGVQNHEEVTGGVGHPAGWPGCVKDTSRWQLRADVLQGLPPGSQEPGAHTV
jgi:hypothetical protein